MWTSFEVYLLIGYIISALSIHASNMKKKKSWKMIFKITKVLIVTQHVLINFQNKEKSIKIIYYLNLQLQFSAIQFTFIVFDFKASKLVCSLHFFNITFSQVTPT